MRTRFAMLLLLAPAAALAQDTLQVGYNASDPPCFSWLPYDFTLNETGVFALADSNQVAVRISSQALGMSKGDLITANIHAQFPPDGTWKDLTLGGYALDAIRFLNRGCAYDTPAGTYPLRAELVLPDTTVIVQSELTLQAVSSWETSSWGRVKALYE